MFEKGERERERNDLSFEDIAGTVELKKKK